MKWDNRIELSQNREKIWKIMISTNKKAIGWSIARTKKYKRQN